MSRRCQGCGDLLPAQQGRGRPRKWCSERCRRRTVYVNECPHCGAEIYDGSAAPPDECGECKYEAKYAERNERLVEMWEAGEPAWYIGEQLGMSETAVSSWVGFHRRRFGEPLSLHRLGGNAEEREARRLQVAAWVREGLTDAEIAERLGTTRKSVAEMVERLRKRGYDAPYRKDLAA